MQLRISYSIGMPPLALLAANMTPDFLSRVVKQCIGVGADPFANPAAYNVVCAESITQGRKDVYGVHIQLTGVTSRGRRPEALNEALRELRSIAAHETVALLKQRESAHRVQLFVVIVTEDDFLELPQFWVTKDGEVTDP